jgi:hypothetical protein
MVNPILIRTSQRQEVPQEQVPVQIGSIEIPCYSYTKLAASEEQVTKNIIGMKNITMERERGGLRT